jgi:hypothetical protein
MLDRNYDLRLARRALDTPATWEKKVKTRPQLRVAVAGCALALSACSTPYSDRLSAIDWSATAAPGTISVSQPRLFRRASLINERRQDADWLNQQLDASKTLEFKPEIAREIEQITAFAAALGLAFDPASAVNYRRSSETGDLQQQIQVMKLQLQLDQLKRDAELAREKFAAQTELVNAVPSAASAAAPSPLASGVTASSADQLKAAIDRLITSLTTRLDIEAKPIANAQTSANPADVFRDRAAYRDLLKSARNAVSLDDLHDHGGGALIRLNFQATVLPDRTTSNIPGVIQMKISPPKVDSADVQRLYRSWLAHVNGQLNKYSAAAGWQSNNSLLTSGAADNFELVEYLFAPPAPLPPPPPAAAGPAPGGPTASATSAKSAGRASPPAKPTSKASSPETPPPPVVIYATPKCPGWRFLGRPEMPGCERLVFAVPKFQGSSGQEGATASLEQYAWWFDYSVPESEDRAKFVASHQRVVAHAKQLARSCALPKATGPAAGEQPSELFVLDQDLRRAQIRSAAGDVFASLYREMSRLRQLSGPLDDGEAQFIATRTARARQLLLTFEQVAYDGCPSEARRAFRASMPSLYIPLGLLEILTGDERVAVYDLGPREQVQQVSTVSRVANSLALAVSLAAAAPTSGAAANAAANYSRQSIGKAAALERVPGLVGYSNAGSFGWVVGPRATLDPQGSLKLEQTPRTMDLSVDLSVPGWWPSFTIETTTAWAASRDAVASGTVELAGRRPSHINVPLEANYADYEVLTGRLKRGGLNETRHVSLQAERLSEQKVSACRATSVYLLGPNIWRAESVLIAGVRLDQAAITVSPDMGGVLLTVPALDELIGDVATTSVPVSVLTRYGDARGTLGFVPKPSSGSCKPAEKKAADGPSITSIVPTQFRAGADVVFTVTGSKLTGLNQVTINGQPGTLTVDKDGKRMQARFIAAQTSSLTVSRAVPLTFYKDTEQVVEKAVEVTAIVGAR